MDAGFDVIVVGGGHAGCEAAAAAARMGARTALVTQRFATIGAMSCNPSIGGLGKGHLVREIDALDGLMGRVADAGRHPVPRCSTAARARPCAARAPRPTASSTRRPCRRRSGDTANLTVIEGEVDDLRRRAAASPACGWPTAAAIGAGAVVLTTGTFLRGLIHIGERQIPAGRVGEAPALGLVAHAGAGRASRSAG